MGGLPEEGVPVMGTLIYWNSVPCLVKRDEASVIMVWAEAEFPSPSEMRTIFLRLSEGIEEA
jgi:hypothetical protein